METKANPRQQTIDGLKRLVEVNRDSAEGFKTVASKVDDPAVERTFRRIADERRRYAEELTGALRTAGVKAPTDGAAKAQMHRWWIGLRGTLQRGDVHAMLEEAERGEDQIKGRYERVLKDTAGSPFNDVLTRQYANVKATHDAIRDLRDATG